MFRIPITRDGYNKIRDELKRLKTVERKKVVDDIKEARSHGDLSENAEYDAAKQKQGLMEAKISDLESKMPKFEVIDISNVQGNGKVVFGTTVEIENIDTLKRRKYKIVGPDESDISDGKISVMSPIARAMINKEVGDEVLVKVPDGEYEYEIISVEFL